MAERQFAKDRSSSVFDEEEALSSVHPMSQRERILVAPPIIDRSQYHVTTDDLAFVGLDLPTIEAWQDRRAPLGVTVELFEHLVETLDEALSIDHVADCDIRLKGSSACFFSGIHKHVPYDRSEIVDAFRSARGRLPETVELDQIERDLEGAWPSGLPHPEQRLFDLFYRLRIERHRSDVDVQLSSDDIDTRVRERLSSLGVEITDYRVTDTTYNFIRKDLVHEVCPHLSLWAAHATDVILRQVSIAVFPGDGPPDLTDDIGDLSSHFRDASDWLIVRGADG